MRWIVIALSCVQIGIAAIMVVSAMTIRSDAAGEGMAAGFAMVAVIAAVLFPLPALILALYHRASVVSLILALTVPVGLFLITYLPY